MTSAKIQRLCDRIVVAPSGGYELQRVRSLAQAKLPVVVINARQLPVRPAPLLRRIRRQLAPVHREMLLADQPPVACCAVRDTLCRMPAPSLKRRQIFAAASMVNLLAVCLGACGGRAGRPESQGGGGGASSARSGASAGVVAEPPDSVSAGSSGSTIVAPGRPSACVFEATLPGGIERCANYLEHRVAPASCPSLLPIPDVLPGLEGLVDAGAIPDVECIRDADCTEKAYGHCIDDFSGPYCNYGCVTDADCGPQQLCRCDWYGGYCVKAQCRTDADCGDGYLCAKSEGCEGEFACQTSGDQCAVSSDCPPEQPLCELVVDMGADGPRNRDRKCQSFNCPVY